MCPLSTAEVSQGSAVTCLRCDETYNNKDLPANLLQNPTVKKFENQSTFAKITLNTTVCLEKNRTATINMT